jgi:hypothetical protein
MSADRVRGRWDLDDAGRDVKSRTSWQLIAGQRLRAVGSGGIDNNGCLVPFRLLVVTECIQ